MTNLLTPSKPKEAKLFRNNRSQAVRIPVELELQTERVLIHREGNKLIIEPVVQPTSLFELLAEWQKESPVTPEHQLPDIEDKTAQPEDIF